MNSSDGKFTFKPEDFMPPQNGIPLEQIPYYIADIANAKLQEWLDKAPEVYQRNSKPFVKKSFETGVWTEHTRASDTHKARLVCIEEIE